MTRHTVLLRVLLVVILALLVGCVRILYDESVLDAVAWPEFAHLRALTYWAVVVGFVPFVAAIGLMFRFLRLVDQGEAFSAATVMLLRQAKWWIGAFAGYFTTGLFAMGVVYGMQSPGVIAEWFVLEVAALFCFAVAALLERLLRAALDMREDVETLV
jgi:hypothetical protein